MTKKYRHIQIPYRKGEVRKNWFDILDAINREEIKNKKKWQERGSKNPGGWVVVNHRGNMLPSTWGATSRTAMKRCLSLPLQRFNGIIPRLFSEWEKHGYKVVKVRWEHNHE